MAKWDAFDGKNILLKNWLDAFRADKAITDPLTRWEPIDGDYAILRKLLFCYNEAYNSPDTSEASWRPMDTENDVIRKILGALRLAPAISSGPAYEWRPIDGTRDILSKILRVTCEINADPDPQANVQPMDNEIWLLRKIVGQQ